MVHSCHRFGGSAVVIWCSLQIWPTNARYEAGIHQSCIVYALSSQGDDEMRLCLSCGCCCCFWDCWCWTKTMVDDAWRGGGKNKWYFSLSIESGHQSICQYIYFANSGAEQAPSQLTSEPATESGDRSTRSQCYWFTLSTVSLSVCCSDLIVRPSVHIQCSAVAVACPSGHILHYIIGRHHGLHNKKVCAQEDDEDWGFAKSKFKLKFSLSRQLPVCDATQSLNCTMHISAAAGWLTVQARQGDEITVSHSVTHSSDFGPVLLLLLLLTTKTVMKMGRYIHFWWLSCTFLADPFFGGCSPRFPKTHAPCTCPCQRHMNNVPAAVNHHSFVHRCHSFLFVVVVVVSWSPTRSQEAMRKTVQISIQY